MLKKKYLIATLLIILTIFMFCFSNYTTIKFNEIMKMIVTIIVPSLTPFMILVQFLILYNSLDLLGFYLQYLSYPIFKISGYGAIIILTSIFGGFPYSAIMVDSCLNNKQIDLDEANRIVKYILFPSLAFMLSTLFKINSKINPNIFYLITFCVYFSGLFLLFITRNGHKKINYLTRIDLDNRLLESNKDSVNSFINVSKTVMQSLLSISFSIIVFSMLRSYLGLFFKGKILNLIAGMFEFSSTAIGILNSSNVQFIDYLILTFIITFSGFSVFFQALPFLKNTNIGFKQLFFSRLICSLISVIFFIIGFYLFF